MIGPTGPWHRLVGSLTLMVCEVRLEDLLPQLAVVRVEKVEVGGDLLWIVARSRDDIPAVCPGPHIDPGRHGSGHSEAR